MGECGQCKFFRVSDARDDRGFCERFPPGWYNNTATKIYIRGWPVLAVGDRCGEFRQYRAENQMQAGAGRHQNRRFR